MNRHALLLLLILGIAFVPFLKSARADEQYTLDKERSSIRFAVDNFDVFKIHGEFTEFDGSFMFCVQHPEKDRVSMTLYAAGIHAANPERDEELQGPHFFDAAHFPRITFASTGVKRLDQDNADVEGNLTLRGLTKPVTFHVHFNGKDSDDDADYVLKFSASATIQRSDFGMDYLSPFVVGNDVQLEIEATGIEAGAGDLADKQP